MNLEVESVLPYNQDETKKSQIESMFDNIAHKYDFLNRFLSLGIDISWRKRAIKEIADISPKLILDMATGTGDFAFEALVLNPEKVIGVDLSQNMLDIGIQKSINRNQSDRIQFIKGDSEHLTYESNYFDAITVGFGVRNFQHLNIGLSELARVLKPGGLIAILEPSFPTNPILKGLFTLHFKYITPIFGKLFSKDARAYTYLPDSVAAFPQGDNFCEILKKQGFSDTKHIPLTFGICALYIAKK
jgi:demethylmenaquinone methyltransferase / 2-methoxy-6-polyprenyl-1,4-benzoquinol methylase